MTLQFNGAVPDTASMSRELASFSDSIEANTVVANAVPLVSGTVANVAQITLTPGVWEIAGVVVYHNAASTVMADALQGISRNTGAVDQQGSYSCDLQGLASAIDLSYVTPTFRMVCTPAQGTLTVYLIARSNFTVSTVSAYGNIRAWRVTPL